MRAQTPWVAAAHPALQAAIAFAAEGAVGLSLALAGTVAVEVHHHGQAVLEANGFDGEGFLMLLWAASYLGLDAEAHLRAERHVQVFVPPLGTNNCSVGVPVAAYSMPKLSQPRNRTKSLMASQSCPGTEQDTCLLQYLGKNQSISVQKDTYSDSSGLI